ncbi:MAG TPA: 16S rRNA (uracil(1498)-N(3))-methyltransferase [Dehalococcoidia bacterium]|nr:16S rRNA (uracil(1498)-N(3))-methyltransferase [Dehalococcoidia bacterium]
MRLPRIYVPSPLRPGPIALSKDQAKRLAAVRRLEQGDDFLAFSGDGREWRASVRTATKISLTAELVEVVRQEALPVMTLELWIGLVRPSRFDWAFEKCTEAGVDVLRPLTSEHSARGATASATRIERWERLAIEASEQCGRLFLPVVQPSAGLETLISRQTANVVICDPDGQRWDDLRARLPERGTVAVAVGPEGGFSPSEVSRAVGSGALLVSLGPNILRTETAAVAATVLARGSSNSSTPVR